MSKSKKASKMAKIPQPIKVKKEKLEEDRALHSMAHFIDDRVELVKQIFGSLKTKTITNLAPEYLKEKDMDEIQELCLNELLCLSKKRLLSIINGTKCPTDTESSEDSDVEAKEEHISLEEISSGSEIENGDKSTKKTTLQSRTKKNLKKANPADNKNGNDGQMSVLELLELQARARAIRSQLALEPVTKIEVDLDDESTTNETTASTTKEQKSNKNRKKLINKETEKSPLQENMNKVGPATAETTNSTGDIENSSNTVSRQKIKLKRNFRKQNPDSIEPDTSEQEATKPQKLKKEKSDRSPSPDVITIVPEPETLCISDSDTDLENVKPKETGPVLQQIVNETPEEAEDGEIIDAEDSNAKEEMENSLNSTENAKTSLPIENIKEPSTIETNKITIIENKILKNGIESVKEHKTDHEIEKNNTKNSLANDIKENDENCNVLSVCEHDIDGDHNDDVISLEGGDLETEMSEHLDEDNSSKCLISNRYFRGRERDNRSKDMKKEDESNDIISLDSSENEDESMHSDNTESWHARYLKSNKVSKVLAVSRLGKRVRDKLKTSKLSKRETIDDNSKEEETDKFSSKHEEGSVEQYKEILELSHRKS